MHDVDARECIWKEGMVLKVIVVIVLMRQYQVIITLLIVSFN